MIEEKRIDFLYSAISDAQELIRFIDVKTAFVITILGAFFISIFSILEDLVKYFTSYSMIFWFILFVFLMLVLCCIAITTRIIKPTSNPSRNIALGEFSLPKLQFYISPNNYHSKTFIKNFKNLENFKLSKKFDQYFESISASKTEDILQSLSFELLKISYIRNIKSDRFNFLLHLLIYTTLLFISVVILFFLERENIKNCLPT